MKKMTFSTLITGVSTLALAAILSGTGAKDAQACSGPEPYIGTVCFTAAQWCPNGYIPADGRQLTVQSNQALFSLIGYYYGGNNTSIFNVPDLRGRSPIGYNPSTINTGGTVISPNTYASLRGSETATLSTSNVAPHIHPATFTGTGGGGSGPMAASGPVTLPVTVSVPAQNISVSGSLKIGSSTAAGAQAISNGAVMTKAGGGQGAIYAPSTTTADTNIGPSQTFSGSTSAAPATGTVTGTVTLPVTGATGITGGTVSVGPNSNSATPFHIVPPQSVLTACIANEGLYPPRPN
ncbi:putative structural domain protein [Magnetospirillum sp. XM-1]|uniref:phage tail protein n=1 Tax=Magnetospirillum sp. XM-1 TaxID=1663591 RepID=UPI00073DE935|nr:tail fiber protein [Magnetospirillum sp. XM-1]CUW39773.1 putative structural domain protein [Magnetospirillum sp. XM-1]